MKKRRYCRILGQLNWGYEAGLQDRPETCDKCGRELGVNHRALDDCECLFYFCEQDAAFYCRRCTVKHKISKQHSDWDINKWSLKQEEIE